MGSKWLSQRDYDFIYARVPRLCVDLVIKGSKGVLLSYRTIEPAKHTWHLIGGRVHVKESIAAAVRRIAKEEAGLVVSVERLLGFMEFPRERQEKKPRHTVSLVFLARPRSGTLRPDTNSSEVRYFKAAPPSIYRVHYRFLTQAEIFPSKAARKSSSKT